MIYSRTPSRNPRKHKPKVRTWRDEKQIKTWRNAVYRLDLTNLIYTISLVRKLCRKFDGLHKLCSLKAFEEISSNLISELTASLYYITLTNRIKHIGISKYMHSTRRFKNSHSPARCYRRITLLPFFFSFSLCCHLLQKYKSVSYCPVLPSIAEIQNRFSVHDTHLRFTLVSRHLLLTSN